MSGVTNIPEGWKENTLGDIVKIKYGKDHKKLKDGDIPCFGSGGVMRYVEKSLYSKPSVLIPRKGTLSNLFFIDKPFWTVDTLFYTEINESEILSKYLFYKLSTIKLEDLNVGSAVPSLTTNVLNQLELTIPVDLSEQLAITNILTSLDDKIALLQAQNKTLEATTQAIFKEWFGKCQVRDELPEGWRDGVLSEFIEIKYGKDHKKLDDGDIPVYGSGGIMRYVDTALYSGDSILIPRKGSLKNLFYVTTPFWSVDTMFYSKIKKIFYSKYCFEFLKTLDLESMNVGSAVPSLTTQVLNNINIIIPNDEMLILFDECISPLYKKKDSNITQIQTLTRTRDTLLPKLMSGEVRVQ